MGNTSSSSSSTTRTGGYDSINDVVDIEINKNKNKSDSKIWKKLMMKYVSVFEFLLWFEFFFNNIKFIENNETLQNPHVLADKYIYVFSK